MDKPASAAPESLRHVVDIVTDLHGALNRLPPEKAEEIRARQREVAACRRRASTNQRILDMRLD